MRPVVTSDWLRGHAQDVVLVDVRWYLDGRSGRDAFDAGHLPDARFVDLDRWLAGAPTKETGRHPLPDPEVFAEGMRQLGVDEGDAVVAYDDEGGVIAARLVWMLRLTGHDAALLDGGLKAWPGQLEAGSEASEEPRREPGDFRPRPWPPEALAELADVIGAEADVVVLDARNLDRYRGDLEPVDPRPGHIPGARALPCRANLSPDGTLLPVAELRRRFAAVGVETGAEVISYCGSGVTACHTLVMLEHAGYAPGRLYAGSWAQYSHTDLPAATGADAVGTG